MKYTAIVLSIVVLIVTACQAPPPAAGLVALTRTSTPAPTALLRPTATPSVKSPTATPISTAIPPTAAPTHVPTTAPTAAPTATTAETPTAAPTASPALAQSALHDVYVIADNSLNFRSEPNASAALLGALAAGTHLTASGEPTSPDAGNIVWQNVRTDAGQAGWVAAQYLSSAAPAVPTPSPPPTIAGPPVVTPIAPSGYLYVAAVNGLNMRADHMASSSVRATLANGQRLQTNGLGFGPDDNGITWINVKIDDGHEGWVSTEFVSNQVPSVAPAAPPANASGIAAELLRRTNDLRQQNSSPPLQLDAGLTTLALAHSQYMAQNGISHTGAGGLSASQRMANAGYNGSPTENIFGGQASLDDAWGYWSSDLPHLANLLTTKNTLIGIGVYQAGLATYYTQDFAQPLQ